MKPLSEHLLKMGSLSEIAAQQSVNTVPAPRASLSVMLHTLHPAGTSPFRVRFAVGGWAAHRVLTLSPSPFTLPPSGVLTLTPPAKPPSGTYGGYDVASAKQPGASCAALHRRGYSKGCYANAYRSAADVIPY